MSIYLYPSKNGIDPLRYRRPMRSKFKIKSKSLQTDVNVLFKGIHALHIYQLIMIS